MMILRPPRLVIVCLGLTSACASRAPLPGPDAASVRTTVGTQIAQSVLAIRGQDTVVAPLR